MHIAIGMSLLQQVLWRVATRANTWTVGDRTAVWADIWGAGVMSRSVNGGAGREEPINNGATETANSDERSAKIPRVDQVNTTTLALNSQSVLSSRVPGGDVYRFWMNHEFLPDFWRRCDFQGAPSQAEQLSHLREPCVPGGLQVWLMKVSLWRLA